MKLGGIGYLFTKETELFPDGRNLFPSGSNLFPRGTKLFPSGIKLFPSGRTSVTLAVIKYTTAETPGATVSAPNILKNVFAKESNILQKRDAKNG